MQLQHDFDQFKICVIVPTYNNAKTLRRVLNGILHYTTNVLVVNDGSTDETTEILSHFSNVNTHHFAQNQGKGKALQFGFRWAKELGYDFAITIDSDGQHYADDLTVFVERLKVLNGQDVLLIGNRNMSQDGIPKKSSFGNRFSNFWFWFETGIQLQDTQSGYRLYPLRPLPKRFYTSRFEFEIEIIVRLAWKNIRVENVPIKVLYDPDERVSHFRPIRDFTRISVLNTVLVTWTIVYIWPKSLLNRGFKFFQI